MAVHVVCEQPPDEEDDGVLGQAQSQYQEDLGSQSGLDVERPSAFWQRGEPGEAYLADLQRLRIAEQGRGPPQACRQRNVHCDVLADAEHLETCQHGRDVAARVGGALTVAAEKTQSSRPKAVRLMYSLSRSVRAE